MLVPFRKCSPMQIYHVSTDLVTNCWKLQHPTIFNVLTGFKFIAERFKNSKENTITYMMGLKASVAIKPFVRDKKMRFKLSCRCWACCLLPLSWLTLADGIEEIYKEYGYYAERQSAKYTFWCWRCKANQRNYGKIPWKRSKKNSMQQQFQSLGFSWSIYYCINCNSLDNSSSDVLKYTLADSSWIAGCALQVQRQKSKFYIAVVGESRRFSS